MYPAPAFRSSNPRTRFERERRAFREVLPALRATHDGQYVAIKDGKVVASGSNRVAVALEASSRVGYRPLYLGHVTDSPPPPVRIPSPRLRRGQGTTVPEKCRPMWSRSSPAPRTIRLARSQRAQSIPHHAGRDRTSCSISSDKKALVESRVTPPASSARSASESVPEPSLALRLVGRRTVRNLTRTTTPLNQAKKHPNQGRVGSHHDQLGDPIGVVANTPSTRSMTIRAVTFWIQAWSCGQSRNRRRLQGEQLTPARTTTSGRP